MKSVQAALGGALGVHIALAMGLGEPGWYQVGAFILAIVAVRIVSALAASPEEGTQP